MRQVLALPRTLATSKGTRMMPKLNCNDVYYDTVIIRMMVDNCVEHRKHGQPLSFSQNN